MDDLLAKSPSAAFGSGLLNYNALLAGPLLRSKWGAGTLKGALTFALFFLFFVVGLAAIFYGLEGLFSAGRSLGETMADALTSAMFVSGSVVSLIVCIVITHLFIVLNPS